MIILKRFILMLQFFTTLPIPFDLKLSVKDFGKGLVLAPIVGLVIGGVMAGAYSLISLILPAFAAAVLLVVLYIILTGGLHLDGLGDTFDGVFSNRQKERILEIMRDSRVGTNAVLVIVCILLMDIALIASFNSAHIYKVLLLMPVTGRIGSLVGAGVSVYARSGEGLGKSFIDFCGIKEVLIGLIPYILIFFLIYGQRGFILAVIPAVTAYLWVKFLSRKIGGATGDVLGAVCELNQTSFLIMAYLFRGT